MNYKNIVILTGGTGTVKLISGLYESVSDKNTLKIITNTADDFSFYGLYVSPDTDAVLYSLSGLLDKTKMWGISNDTFLVKETIKSLDKNDLNSVANWFNLGDIDLAHCLYRTYLLKEKSLTEAIQIISSKIGIKSNIFPMADTPVATYFITVDEKRYHIEEFFIRLQTQPEIKKVEFEGISTAKVSEELIKTINSSELIILGPSNPISSIGPILRVKKIKTSILRNSCPKIVISPIIGTQPVSGPAHKYMEAEGFEVSPLGVFNFYREIGTHFIFHKTDEMQFKEELYRLSKKFDKKVYFADILIPDKENQIRLAKNILSMDFKN